MEFDATFPVDLNGIISQSEFRESIENINRSVSFKKSLIACIMVFVVCVVVGLTLVAVGADSSTHSKAPGFNGVMIAGVIIPWLGVAILIVRSCVIKKRKWSRLEKAIAQESTKYSHRSPRPCSWRLDTTTTSDGYGDDEIVTVTHRVSSHRYLIPKPT